MIEIAKILKPQGIHGEIKVQLFSNNVDAFFEKGFAYDKQGKRVEYNAIRSSGLNVIIKIEGVNNRNDAELLRGVFLYLKREDLEELDENEHYICDLIGLSVADETGAVLGTLKEILQHGAADVYVVKGEKNLMFPALKRVIKRVDDKQIVVDSKVLSEVAVYDD
jgi:16S rRNA processing protein RimM